MALALGVVLAAGPATAQTPARVLNRAEVQVIAQTDTGGATPRCGMVFRIRNVGTVRLSTFIAEIAATDMRNSAALTLPVSVVNVSNVDAGESRDSITPTQAVGASCDQVRVRVTTVTCIRQCESVAWTQQGLGALEAPR
ncbi:hypothetical protein [Roseomonas fluvialis]|nr:hypothetical protein [Roseomonas fluvialis]